MAIAEYMAEILDKASVADIQEYLNQRKERERQNAITATVAAIRRHGVQHLHDIVAKYDPHLTIVDGRDQARTLGAWRKVGGTSNRFLAKTAHPATVVAWSAVHQAYWWEVMGPEGGVVGGGHAPSVAEAKADADHAALAAGYILTDN